MTSDNTIFDAAGMISPRHIEEALSRPAAKRPRLAARLIPAAAAAVLTMGAVAAVMLIKPKLGEHTAYTETPAPTTAPTAEPTAAPTPEPTESPRIVTGPNDGFMDGHELKKGDLEMSWSLQTALEDEKNAGAMFAVKLHFFVDSDFCYREVEADAEKKLKELGNHPLILEFAEELKQVLKEKMTTDEHIKDLEQMAAEFNYNHEKLMYLYRKTKAVQIAGKYSRHMWGRDEGWVAFYENRLFEEWQRERQDDAEEFLKANETYNDYNKSISDMVRDFETEYSAREFERLVEEGYNVNEKWEGLLTKEQILGLLPDSVEGGYRVYFCGEYVIWDA